MGINAALVDRGKLIRREATKEKVDGEVQYKTDEDQPWFRCRFQMIKGSEQQQDGRRRRVVRPALIVGKNAIIKKGDEIEVKSKQHAAIWEGQETKQFVINGDPEPLRKRRTIIGYEATLAAVD